MPPTPPPPDDLDALDALLGRAAHFSGWLIAQITAFLAPEAGKVLEAPVLRWLMRHYLLPAEAILRRAVHLIAETLPPPAPIGPQTAPACHPGERRDPAQPKSAKPRAPLFRLTEPLPRPRTDYLPLNQRPRISVPGLTPLIPAKAGTSIDLSAPLEARLRRRLAALQAAWNAPDKAALRLLRLRARGAVKSPALSFLKIPGARASTLNDIAAPILTDLNAAAFEAATRPRTAPDTS